MLHPNVAVQIVVSVFWMKDPLGWLDMDLHVDFWRLCIRWIRIRPVKPIYERCEGLTMTGRFLVPDNFLTVWSLIMLRGIQTGNCSFGLLLIGGLDFDWDSIIWHVKMSLASNQLWWIFVVPREDDGHLDCLSVRLTWLAASRTHASGSTHCSQILTDPIHLLDQSVMLIGGPLR